MEHIGQVIKQELERQERTVVWLARKLSCDRSNIYRIFQKESIDTNLLVRISVILQYDFFAGFSDSIRLQRKHSKKCTFYTLRFGCSFAAVNTIKPQLL